MGKGKKHGGKGAEKDLVCGCKHVTRADVEAAVAAGAAGAAALESVAMTPAASEPGAETENPLVVHGVYRHFKGDFYLVEDVAHDSETGEEVVVYRKLYGDGSLWVRPKAMFLSPVDHEKYPEVTQRWRFELQHIDSVAGRA